MRIQVKGRNGVHVDDDLRGKVEKRFEKVAKQVSEFAELDVELNEEKNPSIHDKEIAEATLRLKGTTLRARETAEDMSHAINLVAEDLARQVKKHREKRRGRRGGPRPEPAAP